MRWIRWWTAWGGWFRVPRTVGEAESRQILTVQQLRADPKVPRDVALRTQPPEVLMLELVAWLTKQYPRLQGVRWSWFDDERVSDLNGILNRHDPAWKLRPGEPRAALAARRESGRRRLRASGAVAYPRHRVVYFSPKVKRYLSGDVWLRARGARTVMHEAWHLLRLSPERHLHFEEGTADLFAVLRVQELCGADVSATARYPRMMQAMVRLLQALSGRLGCDPEVLLMQSRDAPDQLSWLRQLLRAAGASESSVDHFMNATEDSELGERLCYAAVEDVISEVTYDLERNQLERSV